MKTMLTMMLVILTAWVAFGQNTNFATRIYADFDSPEDGVRDLTMLQGTAPILEVNPVRGTRRINADTGTTVKIVFGPSATNTYFVQTNSYLATNQSYYIQLPTLGTNTCAEGSDVPLPWWYTLLFYSNDGLYWAGEGRMFIEATDATGEALSWQAIAGGVSEEVDPVLAALLATADPNSTNALLADGTLFDISALLAYGPSPDGGATNITGGSYDAPTRTLTPSPDTILATTPEYSTTVSRASDAYGWGNHAEAGYLTEETYLGTITGATIETGEVAQVTTNAGVLAIVVPAVGDGGGITAETATNIAEAVVGGWVFDGFRVATPAIVTNGAAYLWAESNAWWTLDVTGANTLTAAVPWVISTNGLAVGEIPALAVKVALADSETNTWSWGSILTNSVTTPTAGSTNLFMLWWNGAAWVAY